MVGKGGGVVGMCLAAVLAFTPRTRRTDAAYLTPATLKTTLFGFKPPSLVFAVFTATAVTDVKRYHPPRPSQSTCPIQPGPRGHGPSPPVRTIHPPTPSSKPTPNCL